MGEGPGTEPLTLPTQRRDPLDPPPELLDLREHAPISRLLYPDGHVGWLVTSYELGRLVLGDARFSMRPRRLPVGNPVTHALLHDAMDADPASRTGDFLFLDGREHTRVRQAVSGQFSVKRVNEHRPRVERIVERLLDGMEAAGPPCDLIAMFALPVSAETHCAMLGISERESNRFVQPAAVMVDPHTTADEKLEAWSEFSAFVREAVARKRRSPEEDLLSELVSSNDLTDDEIVGCTMLLFGAGHDTTASMLGIGTLALLSRPEKYAAINRDHTLVEPAVEELLRYLTLFQIGAFPRTALEDVELDGVVVMAGESVTVSLSAANRDPTRFVNPDELDIAREAKGHLAFGSGRHMCLGQHLARLELQVALSALVQRFPTLRLAVPRDELQLFSGDHIVYGVRELAVSW